MAPTFGDSSRPKRKPVIDTTASIFNTQKPALPSNAPRITQNNGFFRSQASPIAQHRPQDSEEEGWDMGDDGSDGSVEDDSRGGYEDEDTTQAEMDETDLLKPEFTAFATRLDDSKLLRKAGGNTEEGAAAAFDLIQAFQNYATEHVEETGQIVDELLNLSLDDVADPQHEKELNSAKELMRYWELEHQTWELFGALVTHRLAGVGRGRNRVPRELANDKFACNARIREYFFETDPSFRELTIVLEWLRRYAPVPTADEIEADGLYRGDRGWMYTKEKIKTKKRLYPGKQITVLRGGTFLPSTGNTVTELDPDAPSRQQKHLEEEDEAWERYLMRLVWGFLRKGQLEDARELCEDAGEFWRAASLTGGQDAWDPQIDGPKGGEDNGRFQVTGNRRRELWKRMCYALARRRGGDEYEKAVYGVLSGDVESVLPVCETWEDLLFAHVNSLVEGYYSAKLAELSRIPAAVSQFPTFDAIAYHTRGSLDDETIMPRIVDEISSNEQIHDAKIPLRTVQGSLISLRFPELVQELQRQLELFEEIPNYDPQRDELSIGLDATDPRLMRVVVHVLMVLQALNAGFDEGTEYHTAAEVVIAGYVSTLGEFNKFELVPLYASRLSPEKAIDIVGKTLVKFDGDDTKREELIRSMHLHGIDVDGCLKKTMELSLKLSEPHYTMSLADGHGLVSRGFTDELQPEDKQLIRGLEWLMGSESLREELVCKACEVYKRFLLTGRLSAAKVLFDDVNSKIILVPEADGHADMMDMDDHAHELGETELATAAYLEMETLIEAMIALEKWRNVMSSPPERQDRAFSRKLKPHYESVTEVFPRVLGFFAQAEPSKIPDIPKIRGIYVPEIILALYNVYLDAGRYINRTYLMNALYLATDVANPNKKILDIFRTTGRLSEYVDAIAAASRRILGATQEGARDLEIWTVGK